MNRRSFVTGALVAPLISAAARAQDAPRPDAPPPPPPDLYAEGAPFSREAVDEAARQLATRGFEAPGNILPSGFAELPQDVFRSIRMREDRTLWRGENRGFALDLLPGGFIYRQPVRISLVEDGKVRPLANDPSWFDFGRAPTPPADKPFPFSGASVKAAGDRADELREFALFQGATIFRALARGQILGTSARGLAIDTGEADGEEFPLFRSLWVERPNPGAGSVVVHALLDSRRVTGSYRFTLRPGEITVIDVEFTLFPREELRHVGVAPMTSMYFFGPNDRVGVDDVRGEAHRADGLQIWNGGGEWVWRPLTNPSELQISVFGDRNPRGFGLLQRQRAFPAYNDLNRRYDRMPSVWVEPIGDWDDGQFQLLEIPTDADVNENIVAYWRPKAPLKPGEQFSRAYRLHWCWSPPDRPGGAVAAATVTGSAGGRRRRFVVDFTGEAVADPNRAGAIRPMTATSVGQIRDVVGRPNPEIKGYRVTFDLDPGNEDLCELRMVLEADGKPISETWLYRWTA
ncbi:glucan biosynthesis protein [Methylopila henanensis]|uniref:Glucan biosynthesis protein n=1 Tax=Methylopila henanensis TaxID=873516 RepID=A0ABW4KD19_9HYPH